eukprot:TCALIF_02375-PA protein Name:"Similar to Ccp84Ab Cuticle protein (Anopheles gambiae)" AED:0.07 eAED:0.07 QI:0/0/0/0.5/1/1/2/0/163
MFTIKVRTSEQISISFILNLILPTLFIMLRFVALIALVACAVADNAPYRPAPSYNEPKYDEAPKPYSFQYGVNDQYSGSNFNAQETADGKGVQGSYQVYLPDGRVQTVTYTADHYNGYIADVKYEGEPTYPKYEPKPAPYKPAPYKPAPYKPAPYKPAPSYSA